MSSASASPLSFGDCTICLTALSPADTYAITKCGHTFHQKCIRKWMMGVSNCPTCRTTAFNNDVIKLFFNGDSNECTPAIQSVSLDSSFEGEPSLDFQSSPVFEAFSGYDDGESTEDATIRELLREMENVFHAESDPEYEPSTVNFDDAESVLDASEYAFNLSIDAFEPDDDDQSAERDILAEFQAECEELLNSISL